VKSAQNAPRPKINTLRDVHGDIEEFIDASRRKRKKAWALIRTGYDRQLPTAMPTAA